MATQVSICNRALSFLKAERITSLSDDTESARVVNAIYDGILDEVLRSHPWNFAVTRKAMARSADAPAWGYDYQYPLPADCLRVLDAVGEDETTITDFRIEGRNLLCNETTVNLLYVKRETNPALYDSLFVAAMSYRIAAEIAYTVTASTSLAEALDASFERRVAQARGVDAREGSPQAVYRPTTWISARFGGAS